MSDELKPCAHCAKPGIEVEQRRGDFHEWSIECSGCYCRTDWYGLRDAAIFAWNTRADDAPEQLVDNAQADSREKLEADVYQAAEKIEEFTHGEKFINTNKILRWLDRQAAITKRECSPEAIDNMLNTIGELEEQVGKLTAELETYRKDADQGERMKPQSKENGDTREQLEADLNDWCWQLWENNAVSGYQEANHIKREVWKLLDRQAAITERELCGRCSPYATAKDYLDTIDELTAEREQYRDNMLAQTRIVAELTAERDKLQAELKQERIEWECEFDYAKICEKRLNEMTAERDELREQLNTTRDVAREFRDERDELREALDACGTGTMYELWRRDNAQLEALRDAQHDKPGT